MLHVSTVVHARPFVTRLPLLRRPRLRLIAGLLVAAGALGGARLARAAATNFTVDSPWDWPDNNLGDHLCQTNEPRPAGRPKRFCSLRAAIEQANADGGGNVITVPAVEAHLGIKGLDSHQNFALQDPTLINDGFGCMTLH